MSEIDEVGYAPLVPSAGQPPAPGFRLLERIDVNGLIAYRFVSPRLRTVSEASAAPAGDHARRALRGARLGRPETGHRERRVRLALARAGTICVHMSSRMKTI